jgi:glycosyltransferase involved in cell wall biosynthesis
MRILWLTWKDLSHSRAGGAELVTSELTARLAEEGHEVILLAAGDGSRALPHQDVQRGCQVIRVGSSTTVYWHAFRYIRRHLAQWPDLVVEEVNTIPFLSRLYLRDRPRLILFYQLCREIWFYQLPVPLSLIGYVVEPLYLRMMSRDRAVTISESSRRDLGRFGFAPGRVSVFTPGIGLEPTADLQSVEKFQRPTIASLGHIRPMKRTLHQVRAFEHARDRMPELQLKVAGAASGRYGRRVLRAISHSRHREAIEYLGHITEAEKRDLLARAHVILVTSIKEGWGLIVTEAASQGTPAVVYDADGLRDSVRDGDTGVVTRPTPRAMADALIDLLRDPDRYARLRENGWRWSQEITFDAAFAGFSAALPSNPSRPRQTA